MNIAARAAMRLPVAVSASTAAAAILGLVVPAAAAPKAPATGAPITPKCTAADLGVWVAADQFGAAAGTIYMQLEFTNLTRSACTLFGFPGVSAIGANGREQGSPAVWDHAVAATTVRLAPGGTAHALLEYSDVVTGNCPSAGKRMAFELRVYPPDQDQADHALWDFPTCTAKGSTSFLQVRVIAPGPGVRGDLG
jgi:hypothetical protein